MSFKVAHPAITLQHSGSGAEEAANARINHGRLKSFVLSQSVVELKKGDVFVALRLHSGDPARSFPKATLLQGYLYNGNLPSFLGDLPISPNTFMVLQVWANQAVTIHGYGTVEVGTVEVV